MMHKRFKKVYCRIKYKSESDKYHNIYYNTVCKTKNQNSWLFKNCVNSSCCNLLSCSQLIEGSLLKQSAQKATKFQQIFPGNRG